MSKIWSVPDFIKFILPLILLLGACAGEMGDITPQGGAVFSGSLTLDRAGNNAAAAGGEIRFTTTDDGTGISELSYQLTGETCERAGLTSPGVGSSFMQDPPVEVQNGGFVWDPGQIRVTGTFTSPTQAEGSITIEVFVTLQAEQEGSDPEEVLCDYGTWAWTAEAE